MNPPSIPPAVLVARLEHELETLRLHIVSGAHIAAVDSFNVVKSLAEQIRASLERLPSR